MFAPAIGRLLTIRILLTACLAIVAARPVRASPSDGTDGGATSAEAGSMVAGNRVVLRLRPDVAHAAYAEFAREADPVRRAALRPARLDALSARLAGARLEPEFPGETPGGSPDFTTFWIARLDGRVSLETALAAAGAAPEVIEASPIHLERVEPMTLSGDAAAGDETARARAGGALAAAAPNDSLFGISYWLYQVNRKDIHALEAWDRARGDSTAIVAVIDTGVLRNHPDFAGTDPDGFGNLWTNAAERHGLPGVDDDGDGYVDDVWGWDFVDIDTLSWPPARDGEDWRDPDDDPDDFAVHGTAVSGIVAAFANNGSGTCGVAPQARVMALRVGYSARINAAGIIVLSAAAQAIRYAVRHGATVLNCSFESDQQPDLLAAVDAATAAGVLVVAAAGNNNSSHHYLGDREDVISVNSTDQNDKVTLFSTRQFWVDLCAPGQSIATTTLHAAGTDSVGLRQPTYSNAEAGTSFSAPMVAAAAALMQLDRRHRGLDPYAPYLAQLRITETTDDITALNPGSGYGTGRLNVQRLLNDPPLSTGFPAGAATIGPAVVLPTLSGVPRVGYATADSGLLIMNALNGDTLARVALGSPPVGGLAAATLGPGEGVGIFVGLAAGRLAGFFPSGEPMPGWPVDATTSRGEFEVMPALGDLDGDGRIEVVWGGDDGSVWAWHADGNRVAGFPVRAGSAGRNLRVALGDLDGQPGLEIVASSNSYNLHALHGDGTPLPHWPVVVGAEPTAPTIMRFGANPVPAIVVAAAKDLFAFAPDGTVRFHVTLPANGTIAQDLAAGDLNGDGRDEIVAILQAPDVIVSFDTTGTVKNSRLLTIHSWGPPLIGPLAPGAGAQVLFPSPDNKGRSRLYGLSNTMADLRGWPKSGHPSRAPSMADVDGDGATEIAAGSGEDGLVYLYDAGPGSWRPAAAHWPTPRGNFARTGSRLDAPPLQAVDDVAPVAVGSLAADPPGLRSVVLRWSAPADAPVPARVAVYEIRVGDGPLDAAHFAAAAIVPQAMLPANPGAAESLLVDGLPEHRHRWFAIRSRDAGGNWSAISNVVDLETASSTPAAVADLHVAGASDSSLTLAWTASGDDGRVGRPALYRIRLGTAPLDSAAFESATLGTDAPATADAGEPERATVAGLARGTRYWIALRTVDAAGNVSPLSNAVDPVVGRFATYSGAAVAAARSPSRLPVEIEWQGDPAFASASQSITIYDVAGRIVGGIPLPAASSGIARWNGATPRGTGVRPGIYFLRLRSGPREATGRLVLLP